MVPGAVVVDAVRHAVGRGVDRVPGVGLVAQQERVHDGFRRHALCLPLDGTQVPSDEFDLFVRVTEPRPLCGRGCARARIV